MIPPAELQRARIAGFRRKLLLAMMLVVSAVTLLTLYYAQRSLADNVEDDLEREFQAELAALHNAQEVRHAALAERCRALVRKARIAAALEEDLGVLYLNADEELRDAMVRPGEGPAENASRGLHARFYRFLDRGGAVIPPASSRAAGALAPGEEALLTLRKAPDAPQIGYLETAAAGPAGVAEIIATPIVSSENGEIMAALVLGFEPFAVGHRSTGSEMKSGIVLEGKFYASTLPPGAGPALAHAVSAAAAAPVRIALNGVPHLLFSKPLNPGSQYAPAFEVCVFPLADLMLRQRRLRWQVLGAGAGLLLVGLAASHVMAARLSAPVEKLAVDSEQDRTQRARAEAALEMTHAELQRSARFSADASHQLKTPVTVLRAGLEELMARESLAPEDCTEISALIHQTYRLSSLIEDLLLLSRLDAGRLKLELAAVNLSQLIEASLDDLGALPDEREIAVETEFPPALYVQGEKRYTAIVLQNLLENARKYNRSAGRIRIVATTNGGDVRLVIANTGGPISPEARAHIFERFHRGPMGENVPGYGLGLNLARELARLHRGDLRLTRSDETWTEFEVSFRLAHPGALP